MTALEELRLRAENERLRQIAELIIRRVSRRGQFADILEMAIQVTQGAKGRAEGG